MEMMRGEWKLEKQLAAVGEGEGEGVGVGVGVGVGRRRIPIPAHCQDDTNIRNLILTGGQEEETTVKLAATAITLDIRLRSADMPFSMQQHALHYTASLLRSLRSRRPNLTLIACSLKKEFDRVYGPAWHCVVGKSFGSFVTHTPAGFLYFSIDRNQDSSKTPLSFLLFKTEVLLVPTTS